jgi:hypothetical protein
VIPGRGVAVGSGVEEGDIGVGLGTAVGGSVTVTKAGVELETPPEGPVAHPHAARPRTPAIINLLSTPQL